MKREFQKVTFRNLRRNHPPGSPSVFFFFYSEKTKPFQGIISFSSAAANEGPAPGFEEENPRRGSRGFSGELTTHPFPLPHLGRLGVVSVAKILIFDEYPSIRNLLAEELAGEGSVILAIGRPELIREGVADFKPELAILDLFLRGSFRWEFLREIRRQAPALPVILYSGYYPRGDPHLAQVEGFILKSCFLDELKQFIHYVLSHPIPETSLLAG